ncbi:MAG: 16S rRNA (uracil(1498)-N(3))-methyltransferase [Paracoccaceae bacterium]
MARDAPRVRLHLDAPLDAGATVEIGRDQANYLAAVLRLGEGERIAVFNGRDGEWAAVASRLSKRSGALAVEDRLRPPAAPPDLWLCFAPIKKTRTDFVVEKATELGARRVVPVMTRRTNAERVNRERLQAHAVEAAEQCGLVFVPAVAEPVALGALLDGWPEGRRLMVCDERAAGFGGAAPETLRPASAALAAEARETPEPWAILCGPEGGFEDAEIERLSRLTGAIGVGLGPRVLRADTAAVAALALWQATLGDWR